ncbi:hypothetical protein ABZW67_02010 [Streptomyces rubiginosohelvolus]|uniref:hypothetical protein n=1 Tax=Streptomyces rubiginosohelvolus TaxID=67362 RepID=UPI0033B94016
MQGDPRFGTEEDGGGRVVAVPELVGPGRSCQLAGQALRFGGVGDGELLDPLCRDGVVHAVTGDDDELFLGNQYPGHRFHGGVGEVAAQVILSREGQRLGRFP